MKNSKVAQLQEKFIANKDRIEQITAWCCIALVSVVVIVGLAINLGPRYALNDDGSGYILKNAGYLSSGHFEVPAEYKGKPVVELGETFNDTSLITSATIPASVTAAHRYCFATKFLKEIHFAGTKEQWADILAEGVFIYTDLPVFCADGQYDYLADSKPCE